MSLFYFIAMFGFYTMSICLVCIYVKHFFCKSACKQAMATSFSRSIARVSHNFDTLPLHSSECILIWIGTVSQHCRLTCELSHDLFHSPSSGVSVAVGTVRGDQVVCQINRCFNTDSTGLLKGENKTFDMAAPLYK